MAGTLGLPRSSELYFLDYLVTLLRAPELGLSKVGRLTRVYEQLDYPDGEAAAPHLASALVHALRPVATP